MGLLFEGPRRASSGTILVNELGARIVSVEARTAVLNICPKIEVNMRRSIEIDLLLAAVGDRYTCIECRGGVTK